MSSILEALRDRAGAHEPSIGKSNQFPRMVAGVVTKAACTSETQEPTGTLSEA